MVDVGWVRLRALLLVNLGLFLLFLLGVLLTGHAFLVQEGSAESRPVGKPALQDEDPRGHRDDPEAPWPVRQGSGLVLRTTRPAIEGRRVCPETTSMPAPGRVQNDRMADAAEGTDEAATTAERVAEVAREGAWTVAVAESLTSGNIACQLGAASDASSWFTGGVVAYASEVKFELLGVDPGPVVTALCAEQMARGVARLTGADFAVAVTGVGGPEPDEGHPAGTVFLAVSSGADEVVTSHRFPGNPQEVVKLATVTALQKLLTAMEDARS